MALMRDAGVTLANWQDPVMNRWGFCHVRELMPTAQISRSGTLSDPLELGSPIDLASLSFDTRERRYTALEAMDESYTDALVVLHDGRVVAEWYGPEMAPARTHLLMSVSKSITSTLAGVLIGEGALLPDDEVTTYVEEFVGTAFEGSTVQHLLDMRAGVRFSEDYADLDADVRRYEQAAGSRPRTDPDLADNLYDYMPTLTREGDHGGPFAYKSILTDALAWVLERAGGAPFADLLSSRIWSKIGAEHDADVSVDARGGALADGGICTTARDLARFGLMVLRGGTVKAEPVVPREWIDGCTRPDERLVEAFRATRRTPGYERFSMYHNNWWVLDSLTPRWAGIGINGQMLYLDADKDTVVVKFSTWPDALDAHLGEVHFSLAQALVARASERHDGGC